MAAYARDLTEWKRQQLERELDCQHAEEEVNEEGFRKLDECEISVDSDDYEDE